MARAEWITQREFARRVGVSHTMIAKAIGKRIKAREEDGKINWVTQEANWNKNRDPSKERGAIDAGTPASKPKSRPETFAPIPADKNPGEAAQSVNYAVAKTASETLKAKMLQLEYEKAIGTTVSKESVESAVFVFARTVRDSVMNLPDRVAAESAAEIITYLRPILTAAVGDKKTAELMESISLPDLTRIMHRLWDREGRFVLEHLDRGAEL